MIQASTQRSTEAWLRDLRATGAAGRAAHVALHELVSRAVARAAHSVDESTREDLTQVAVLRVLTHLDRFEGRSRFSTWAYSVAVRAAFGELRKVSYRSGGEALSDETSGQLEATGPAPTTVAERGEIVEVMRRVIARELSVRQRTAIQGELAGTPQAELLIALNINRNALYKLFHDARKKLRDGLAAAGISDDQVRDAFDL
ncbi:MAG: sigma-70 family RNA polymerase sigma factor [Planctomycetota bacterium]